MVSDTHKHPSAKRSVLWIVLLVFVFSTFAQLVGPTIPYASAKPSDDSSKTPTDWDPNTEARRWAVLNALHACVSGTGWDVTWQNSPVIANSWLTTDKVESGNWFVEKARKVGSHLASDVDDESRSSCNSLVSTTATQYSMTPLELFCALGGKREDGSPCAESVTGSNFDTPPQSGRLNTTKVWGRNPLPGAPSGAAIYAMDMAALKGGLGCKIQPGGDGTGNFAYKIQTVSADGTVKTENYTGVAHDTWVGVFTDTGGTEKYTKCVDLATDLNKYANAYAAWVKGHQETPPKDNSSTEEDKQQTSCVIDLIGWAVCSASRGVATFVGLIFDLLTLLVAVPPIVTNTQSGIYPAWEIMRNIANVVFVILFILIIYSQMMGGGKR